MKIIEYVEEFLNEVLTTLPRPIDPLPGPLVVLVLMIMLLLLTILLMFLG